MAGFHVLSSGQERLGRMAAQENHVVKMVTLPMIAVNAVDLPTYMAPKMVAQPPQTSGGVERISLPWRQMA